MNLIHHSSVFSTFLLSDAFWLRKITTDPHTLAPVNLQWPDDFFPHGATALVGHGIFIIEVARSHTTFCRTPLEVWSARRSELYLTTHNTHKRQTTISPSGIETAIPGRNRPQTHVRSLGSAAQIMGIHT